jgi:hypothetical protein
MPHLGPAGLLLERLLIASEDPYLKLSLAIRSQTTSKIADCDMQDGATEMQHWQFRSYGQREVIMVGIHSQQKTRLCVRWLNR